MDSGTLEKNSSDQDIEALISLAVKYANSKVKRFFLDKDVYNARWNRVYHEKLQQLTKVKLGRIDFREVKQPGFWLLVRVVG